jgi:CRISPR-associated endonuclease Csn1
VGVVFGFDVGISGFAAVIRHDNDFVWAKSFVLPPEYASTKMASVRRRMARTRQAHRAREWWWNTQANELGIETLKAMQDLGHNNYRTVAVDPRLLREFPARGDETIYTSCLLRCALVLGQAAVLEPWQIYKAVHSAIQKRGYDPDVIWKTRSLGESKNHDADEDAEEQTRLSAFEKELERIGIPEEHRLPCFFEAFQMGLWHPEGGILGLRQSGQARPGGLELANGSGFGFTASRRMVERELRLLLEQVRTRYPKLDVDYVLYGPGRVPYASHPRMRKDLLDPFLRPGKATDWQGLLGQKIPRFDNRVIAKCLLMPRGGVCRASEPLVASFTFLKTLHNVRVRVLATGEGRRLNFQEFTHLARVFESKGKAKAKQLEKELVKLGLGFEGTPYDLEAARTSGRSAFCRPALRLLVELLRSGQPPAVFYELVLKRERAQGHAVTIEDNPNSQRGLITSDLRWLEKLALENRSWQDIYLPQERLNQCYEALDPDQAMRMAMAHLNNPVVRHRLYLFRDTLRIMNTFVRDALGQKDGPDRVVLEFVREDFLGEKAKKKLEDFQKEQRKRREQAKIHAAELGLTGREAILKMMLHKRQSGQDPYDPARNIGMTEVEACEVDHIVPVSAGGPDAQYNMVLTRRDLNGLKGDRTPWEWLHQDNVRWKQFVVHVDQMQGLPSKTKRLLTSEDATSLVERYQGLAETAWIARLAGTIVRCELGWSPADHRLEVVSGGVTARVRGENRLNDLLGDPKQADGDKSPKKKDRSDIRHHLLDAMVISFCRQWSRDPSKKKYFKLPNGVTQETFATVLRASRPIEVPEPPRLEEQFYGLRAAKDGQVMTRKKALLDLPYKTDKMRPILDRKELERLRDHPNEGGLDPELAACVARAAGAALAARDTPEDVWRSAAGGIVLKNGSTPRRVQTKIAISEESKVIQAKAILRGQPPLHGIQVIKPKGSHSGFLVSRPPAVGKGHTTWRAKPIYCWQNPIDAMKDLKEKGWEVRFRLRSKDYVRIGQDCDNLKAGIYKIVTIKNGSSVFLKGSGDPTREIQKSINILMEKGALEPLPHHDGSLL